jgi:hypothetical protein
MMLMRGRISGFKLFILGVILLSSIDSSAQDGKSKDSAYIVKDSLSRGQVESTTIKDTTYFLSTRSPSLISRWPYKVSRPSLTATQKRKRQWLSGGVLIGGYGATLIALNSTWYKNYPHTKFHTFDDSREWLQVDKVGHAWTAYTTSAATTEIWQWAGVPHKQAVLLGGLSGFAFLTGIEFLDAHSSKWGWSWSDIGANFIGTGMFMGQELLWGGQAVQFKFSFHSNTYNDPQLDGRADNLFGASWYERALKDYNAQTYWLSVNLHKVISDKLPAWLNLAVGYGATGMFGGFENSWLDNQGNNVNRFDIKRKRQFYLSPDIDLTKIKTKSKFLRTSFAILNCLKIPAPTLMLDNSGKLKAYAVYF